MTTDELSWLGRPTTKILISTILGCQIFRGHSSQVKNKKIQRSDTSYTSLEFHTFQFF